MFPKGPRFQPMKVPDVPAPNAYNIPQESVLDNYKRGAFLEKANRFSKDNPSAEPAPTHKPSSSMAKLAQDQSAVERYNLLQKKVDELEKVHLEGKRAHLAELERCRQDLATSRKAAVEQADRYEKQKKQNAIQEARLQELKKASAAEQSELKEVKHKLRLLELERDKNSSKQPEILELKKTLTMIEAKRKEELKERDRRIAELERQVQAEQKKKETSEIKVKDSRRALEEEARSLKSTNKDIESRLQEAQNEARAAKEKLSRVQDIAGHREAELLHQLEQHRCLLATVAQQYGALATQSVQATVHRQLELDYAALKIRQLRLERKLANSEGQVIELTHLFRQVREDNAHLNFLLRDAWEENEFKSTVENSSPPSETSDHASIVLLKEIGRHITEDREVMATLRNDTNTRLADLYRLKSQELCLAASVLAKEEENTRVLAEQRASDLSSALASHEAIAGRLEFLQKEKTSFDEKLALAMAEANEVRTSATILEARLTEAQQELKDSAAQHVNAAKNDKDTIQRLSSTVQKSRVAEVALREEIDQLTAELAEAERFQDAYYSLSNEVNALLVRNEIAESEAERISKFNAEILGHHNPAQRIMYVDRIRRELAEAKHKIGLLTKEQEDIAYINDALQNELDMYKSVQVPLDSKPRTNITRIGRAPLVNLAASMNASTQPVGNSVYGKGSYAKPALEVIKDGDMTTDELL
ncbi:hypothetical protein BDN70DRAFT_872455 [Pholiota conissans]|uniref:Uncharacterized protein n=1 Tax=Pholiota conissans TaxID=109636 RepID=A0A9P5ZEH7_9AGAR|nr:hypothetical protein BDN70DRAFT_872455 [Pholiota conissans]